MGRDLMIQGHMLHVEEFGAEVHPSVLFLHGGPGMGAYHFETRQAERLQDRLRVITLDQRGVLRSAPLEDGEPLGVMDLVADCEELRQRFGIEHWSVIGHSFGGYLAVLYALTRPASVDRLVLDSASLDPGSSARSLLAAAAMEFALHGDQESVRTCLALAHAPKDASVPHLWQQLTVWLGRLGEWRDNLYMHGDDKRLVDDVMDAAPFPAEWWQRGGTHQVRLVAEGAIFMPLLDRLAGVRQKTLMIRGLYDPVLASDQMSAYLAAKPETELRIFPNSAHFAHLEEPDRFAKEVLAFLGDVS